MFLQIFKKVVLPLEKAIRIKNLNEGNLAASLLIKGFQTQETKVKTVQ